MKWVAKSLIYCCCTSLLGLGSGLTSAIAAESNEPWHVALVEAQSDELAGKNLLAVSAYQKALKLLPAADQNERAKLLLALAVCCSRVKDYEATIKNGREAVAIIRAMSTDKKLDPDVILSGMILVEVLKFMPDFTPLKYKIGNIHTIQRDWSDLLVNLKMAVNSRDLTVFSDAIVNARTYVALNDNSTAKNKLLSIQAQMPATAPDYWPVRANIAGLENRQGDNRSTVKLIENLKRIKSPFETLMTVADGQFWAGDYKHCAETLETARYLARKARSASMESRIEAALARSATDRGDGQGAKEHLNIANQLAQQANRGAGSNLPPFTKVPHIGHKEYEFILTEQEKAAVRRRKLENGNSK